MRQTLLIAVKEWRDGLRNRWVIATTALLAALALTLAFLGSAPTGTVKVGGLAVTVVSLSSLTIFLVPLIALLLSYDAIVGEIDRGTMSLLLTYPVARWQVLLGKFIGHLAILVFATVVGYGTAGLAAQWAGSGDAGRLGRLRPVDRDFGPARRRLHRHRLFDQHHGGRPRRRRRNRGRRLVVLRADLRHGPARRPGGRPGPHDDARPCSTYCCWSIRPMLIGCSI